MNFESIWEQNMHWYANKISLHKGIYRRPISTSITIIIQRRTMSEIRYFSCFQFLAKCQKLTYEKTQVFLKIVFMHHQHNINRSWISTDHLLSKVVRGVLVLFCGKSNRIMSHQVGNPSTTRIREMTHIDQEWNSAASLWAHQPAAVALQFDFTNFVCIRADENTHICHSIDERSIYTNGLFDCMRKFMAHFEKPGDINLNVHVYVKTYVLHVFLVHTLETKIRWWMFWLHEFITGDGCFFLIEKKPLNVPNQLKNLKKKKTRFMFVFLGGVKNNFPIRLNLSVKFIHIFIMSVSPRYFQLTVPRISMWASSAPDCFWILCFEHRLTKL